MYNLRPLRRDCDLCLHSCCGSFAENRGDSRRRRIRAKQIIIQVLARRIPYAGMMVKSWQLCGVVPPVLLARGIPYPVPPPPVPMDSQRSVRMFVDPVKTMPVFHTLSPACSNADNTRQSNSLLLLLLLIIIIIITTTLLIMILILLLLIIIIIITLTTTLVFIIRIHTVVIIIIIIT